LKTNDFDVVVRNVSITHSSQWAKMGLMVREDLTGGSRNFNIISDPASADGIMAPDGSGFGANDVECNARQTVGGASGGWRNLAGGTVPAYPNAWVRLKRVSTTVYAYYSTNSNDWVPLASFDTSTLPDGALSNVVYVGLCTTAHNNDLLGGPPPPPFKFYNTVEYASYNSSYSPPAAHLSVSVSGANLTVRWTPIGGRLLSAPSVLGPWTPVGTANPATIAIGAGPQFFRVVNP
jgi:hypothetical protein